MFFKDPYKNLTVIFPSYDGFVRLSGTHIPGSNGYICTCFPTAFATWKVDSENPDRSYKSEYRTVVDEIRAVLKRVIMHSKRRIAELRRKQFDNSLL